jgi:hypothetical protein
MRKKARGKPAPEREATLMGHFRTRAVLSLILFPFAIGCAGLVPEETARPREPAVPQADVSPPAAVSVPDEAEAVRMHAREMLLGKWRRDAQGGDTIEFFDDGTVSFFSAVEKVAYPGSFRILDKARMEIQMKSGAPLTWGYAVTKGELTLTTPTGMGMKYKRYRGK